MCRSTRVWDIGPLQVEVYTIQVQNQRVHYLVVHNKISGKALPAVDLDSMPVHVGMSKGRMVVMDVRGPEYTQTIPILSIL
jgi:hypothetical protein